MGTQGSLGQRKAVQLAADWVTLRRRIWTSVIAIMSMEALDQTRFGAGMSAERRLEGLEAWVQRERRALDGSLCCVKFNT